MCTLIAFHRVWDDWPLVVATNRDEAYDRPSKPPRWIRHEGVRILAPCDARAGGTWMGASERGVWVGVTNLHRGDVDPARRSRGLLCLDLLARSSAAAVVDRLGRLEEPYNPFRLVAADGRETWRVEYEDGEIECDRVEPGFVIVTNRPRRAPEEEPKVGRAVELLDAADLGHIPAGTAAPEDLVERLAGILADHGRGGRDALCLHGGRYGTRSAAVWRMRPGDPGSGFDEGRLRLDFAEGPPCSSAFGSVTAGRGGIALTGRGPRR